jgi:hypothetical protein
MHFQANYSFVFGAESRVDSGAGRHKFIVVSQTSTLISFGDCWFSSDRLGGGEPST